MTDCKVILAYLPDGRTPVLCQATLPGHQSHFAKVRKDEPVSVADVTIPEGLCGISGCVFTPHPERIKHSWQQ